jgi:hypothetical protein
MCWRQCRRNMHKPRSRGATKQPRASSSFDPRALPIASRELVISKPRPLRDDPFSALEIDSGASYRSLFGL